MNILKENTKRYMKHAATSLNVFLLFKLKLTINNYPKNTREIEYLIFVTYIHISEMTRNRVCFWLFVHVSDEKMMSVK